MAKPLPHLLDGQKWKVKESELSVTYRPTFTVRTSWGNDKISRYLRFKELVGSAYGIPLVEDEKRMTYAEGCRLNFIIRDKGWEDATQTSLVDDMVDTVREKGHKSRLNDSNYVDSLKLGIISLYPFSAPVVDALGKTGIEKGIRKFINEAPLSGDFYSKEFTVNLHRYIDDLVPSLFVGTSPFKWVTLGYSLGIFDESDYGKFPVLESPQWGTLDADDFVPEMEVVARPKRRRAVKSPKAYAQEGVIPLRWDRWSIDKGIFVVRRKVPSVVGSVLLDLSGSMSLSLPKIRAIIKQCPTAIILGYRANKDLQSGRLIVLGDKGRIATEEGIDAYHEITVGENVVDGPALLRLCSLPPPRFWISDGNVTGVAAHTHPGLREDRDNIVKVGEIKQVLSVDTIVELLHQQNAEDNQP